MIFVRNKSEVPKLMAGLPLFRKIEKSLNTQPLPMTNSILSEQIVSAFSTPAMAPNATLPPLIALAFLRWRRVCSGEREELYPLQEK